MIAQVLNDPLFKFQQSGQKAIVRTKACATHKWGSLENYALQIKLTSKSTLVKLASSKLLAFLGIPTWGVGSKLPNVMTKLEKDNDIVDLIQASKVFYAKGLRMFRIVRMDEIFKQKGTHEGDHSNNLLS
jgi:hypothetical protein